MTYKIAIANEKGGVAKTTSTVSIGGALVELGKKVLVVDLDPQANLTLALGIRPTSIKDSIAKVVLNSEDPRNVVHQSKIEGLDLIPSNTEMGLAERFLPIRQNFQSILKNSFHGWKDYDYIIFDCPPALGAVTVNALSAANLLVIPTQAEYFSIYALKKMMSTVRQIRDENNPTLIYRILITMLDRRNRTHRTLFEQLHTTFNDGLFSSIVEVDTKLRESPIVGVPITSYFSKSRSAEQYRALTQEIINNVQTIKKPAMAESS